MESSTVRFILSGSSTRKLKRGGANMLGGRALLRHIHPFTVNELENGPGVPGPYFFRSPQFFEKPLHQGYI